jgi:hypothetical protein
LAALPDSHPAKQVLILRAICRRDCAGREIPWPGREEEAIDQEWMSAIDSRRWSFSGFIYAVVCFDLTLDEWLTHPQGITDGERSVLENVPRLRRLLEKCRAAAQQQNNRRVLDMLPKAEAFIAEWDRSVRQRLQEDRIPLPQNLDRPI